MKLDMKVIIGGGLAMYVAQFLVGGVTGMPLGLDWGAGYPLFIVWQGAFALCLALAFPSAGEKSAS